MRQQRSRIVPPRKLENDLVLPEPEGSAFVNAGFVNSAAVGTDKGASRIPDYAGAFNTAVSGAAKAVAFLREDDINQHKMEGGTAGVTAATDAQTKLIEQQGTREGDTLQRIANDQTAQEYAATLPYHSQKTYLESYRQTSMGFQIKGETIHLQKEQTRKLVTISTDVERQIITNGTFNLDNSLQAIRDTTGVSPTEAQKNSGALITSIIANQEKNFFDSASRYSEAIQVVTKNMGSEQHQASLKRVLLSRGHTKTTLAKLPYEERKTIIEEAESDTVKLIVGAMNVYDPHTTWASTTNQIRKLRVPSGQLFMSTKEGVKVGKQLAVTELRMYLARQVSSFAPIPHTLTGTDRNGHLINVAGNALNHIALALRSGDGSEQKVFTLLSGMSNTDRTYVSQQVKQVLSRNYNDALSSGDMGQIEQVQQRLLPMIQLLAKSPSLFNATQDTKLGRHSILYTGGLRGTELLQADESIQSVDLKGHPRGAKTVTNKQLNASILKELAGFGMLTDAESANAILEAIVKAEIAGVDLPTDAFKDSFIYTSSTGGEDGQGNPIADVTLPTGGAAFAIETVNPGAGARVVDTLLKGNPEIAETLTEQGLLVGGAINGDITMTRAVEGGGYWITVTQDNIFNDDKKSTFALSDPEYKKLWNYIQTDSLPKAMGDVYEAGKPEPDVITIGSGIEAKKAKEKADKEKESPLEVIKFGSGLSNHTQ